MTFFGGVSGVLAGLLWWALSPLMATVGFCQGSCSVWEDKPWIIRGIGQWLAAYGWFSAGEELYFRYGRLFVLVYLLIVVALLAFHLQQSARGAGGGQSLRRGFRLLLIALLIAASGDFFSYGIGVFSEAAWRYGFAAEMLALLLVAAGSIWYGVAISNVAGAQSWAGFVLVTAGAAIPVMLLDRVFVMYLPNGPMFPLAFAWSVLGIHMIAASWSRLTLRAGGG